MAIAPIAIDHGDRRAAAKLVFDGVSKRFGCGPDSVLALARAHAYVGDGDFLCLVGPSGCGKSTLLNVVAGFEAPSAGEVRLDGRVVRRPGAERCVVFQQGALFTWMTVVENVAFGPRARGRPAAEARDTAMGFLEMVGLAGFAKRYPYELSGGMQQRVGIARALANDPAVLLMDEPFAALDQQTRELLQEEIKGIWRRTRKTVLWITHSIEEALFLATHLVVMTARPGRIKASYEVDFDTQGDRMVTTSAAFTEAKREIVGLLRAESLEAQRQEGVAR